MIYIDDYIKHIEKYDKIDLSTITFVDFKYVTDAEINELFKEQSNDNSIDELLSYIGTIPVEYSERNKYIISEDVFPYGECSETAQQKLQKMLIEFENTGEN